MDNVHHLRVAPKFTEIEEVRHDAIQLLEKTLAEARAGEIDEIVILAKCSETHPHDEEWVERASATLHFRAWLGALELLKSSWIETYRAYRSED